MKSGFIAHLVLIVGIAILLPLRSAARSTRTSRGPSSSGITETPQAQKRIAHLRHTRAARRTSRRRRRRSYERFYTSSYADGVTEGDVITGEDPVVRASAIDALGNMNGTVVAIDPDSGRVLSMVNQKLALSGGAQPCSTIKLAVALAALNERIVDKETEITLGRRSRMNLTEALAHSNNAYFEALGRRLGFEKVSYYAHEYGLGELAGYNIPGEHLGVFPSRELAANAGGVARMCSFGESISMTPLQLGALVAAMANGGTLFYLQHPTQPEEIAGFVPKVKRQLDIAPLVPAMADGMAGAVQYGTARSVRYNFSEEPVLGKTGTCSHDGTRFGWFASYAKTDRGQIVVVVFLQGGRPTFGPKAAEIAGRMYRNLYDRNFFAATPSTHAQRDLGIRSVGVSQ
ncbi:MAG TPA: penicillin-binding transpeptidase domain-containing protein [Terriglobales bacterium]|nr:penicillin-binding transpeptidase domain-containing protein [Terriglobales bacterium]